MFISSFKLNFSRGVNEIYEGLRKQHGSLRKNHEESKLNMKMYKEEYFQIKKVNEDINKKYEKIMSETKAKDKFIQDIKTLLSNQGFNDLTINVGNEMHLAHKCILAARSEKLRKLLEPVIDPADKKHQRKLEVNNLQFTDVSESIMPIFMNYLYTGSVDKKITHDNVGEVLKLAEKFELDDLKDMALNFMEVQIDRSTVIPILIQASHHENEKLKNRCIEFIVREAPDLIDSPQWKSVKRDNPGAALEVYEARMKSMGQEAMTARDHSQETPTHNEVNGTKSPRKSSMETRSLTKSKDTV
jgi:hypothetical protein